MRPLRANSVRWGLDLAPLVTATHLDQVVHELVVQGDEFGEQVSPGL
jgi:hypothetical protein